MTHPATLDRAHAIAADTGCDWSDALARAKAETDRPTRTVVPASLFSRLAAVGAPWGQHWVRGGWAGTAALQAELEAHGTGLPAYDATLDMLAAIEATQRSTATHREREWQTAVEEVCARRGQLLSAATDAERREVADRLAQAVQRLVLWGAG